MNAMRSGKAVFALALSLVLPLSAAAQALPYAIVGTGQTQCFDDRGPLAACPQKGEAFWGQDANHPGRAPRYLDRGDGTVQDLVTGLMWQKGFVRSSFAGAAELARASRVGGYSDWRVPSIKEMYSLMLFSGSTGRAPPHQSQPPADARPYLDTSVFDFEYPRQGRFIDAQYVSTTTYRGRVMDGRAAFFGVNFADGRIKGYPQDGGPGGRLWYARWVRGNPLYGRNDFVAQPEGTVLDRATGLTWMQADSGAGKAKGADALADTAMGDGRLDWREALAFCANLRLAGHQDWRLPNAKELQSLVDYTRSPDATGSAAISPLFAISTIREADAALNWPYFWSATSHQDGPRQGDFAVYLAFGRALGYFNPRQMGPPNMGPPGWGRSESEDGARRLMDVHGAGAQRSSPKSGDESRLPRGAGPQGDVLRIYNYARCVR